jgi:hypothetical protein
VAALFAAHHAPLVRYLTRLTATGTRRPTPPRRRSCA